jgi:hypothetical protein
MATKLKDRLEFNRWGLIALAALYVYIFSHPVKPLLFWVPVFWVPVFLSLALIVQLLEEHRMVAKIARYIEEQIEPWIKGVKPPPEGWEIFLKTPPGNPPWWRFRERWPWHLWDWSPVPMWVVLLFTTLSVAIIALVVAIAVSLGWWPSLNALLVSTPASHP